MRYPSFHQIIVFCLLFVVLGSGQSIEGLMNAGTDLLSNGAFNEAATNFRRVIARDPGNFEAHHNLGFAYLQLGRNAEAVKEFRAALGINAKSGESWLNMAVAYENLGNTKEAISALGNAVNIDPNNLNARNNLATMYANAGQVGQAIVQYKQIIQIDGNQIDAYLNLARCLASTGKGGDAKEYLTQALNTAPGNAEVHYELGNYYWKTEKNQQKACPEYETALKLEANSQNFYENYGLLLQEMGKKQEAIEVWKQFLVYLDDALAREKVQKRIDALEHGESAAGTPMAAEKPKGASNDSTTDRLRQEMRTTEKTQVRTLNAKPVDVSNDFDDLNSPQSAPVDLKAEAKKRSAKK
jgi:tetratricopeptide (TPR) repeat protein